jgi:hypothetical protein
VTLQRLKGAFQWRRFSQQQQSTKDIVTAKTIIVDKPASKDSELSTKDVLAANATAPQRTAQRTIVNRTERTIVKNKQTKTHRLPYYFHKLNI